MPEKEFFSTNDAKTRTRVFTICYRDGSTEDFCICGEEGLIVATAERSKHGFIQGTTLGELPIEFASRGPDTEGFFPWHEKDSAILRMVKKARPDKPFKMFSYYGTPK